MPFNRLNHSILGVIRPRFYLKIDAPVEKCLYQMSECLKKDATVSGIRSGELIFLKIPINEQHYWSPEMTVRIEKDEFIDYTSVSCLIGPRQTVWVMFTLIYAAITISTLFASMFGFVQYSNNGYSAWLWFLPIGILLISTIFIAAKIGQRKGRNQMLHLVSFTYHSLAEIGDVERLEVR